MNQRTELRQHLRRQGKLKKATQNKSPEQTLVLVQIALTLLPLLTACIYLFGMTRHMGYLKVFHIDSSEFPLSTEQNLLMGVVALASNVLPLIIYPLALVGALMLLGAIIGVVAQISQQIMISPAPSDRYTRGFLTGRPRVFSLFIALTYAITSPT